MKKLLLFLMLFTVGLTARSQVVYLTLDQDGMERKTDDAGKIYYAITGKVHNMKALKLTPSNYSVVAYYPVSITSDDSFNADITATETDTTFTLTVPWNVPLNTQVKITCQPKNNGNNDLGISPYVFTTCGFQSSIDIKRVSWGTDKKITYTCQYKQKISEGSDEAILPSSLKDFNSITFLPINRTYSLIGESYDGSKYNQYFQQKWGGSYPDGQFGDEDTLTYKDNATDNTFSFSSSAIAGKLKINWTIGEWSDTIATKLLSAYTVDLSLKDNATDKTKKVVHAEVTDAAGNKVSGGNINYAIGSGPSDTYYPYEISSMVFYENNLEHFSSVSSVAEATGVSSRTDSTGVHTFNYLDDSYYKTAAVSNGTVDIDCDMTNWMNRKIGKDGSSEFTLRIYFWYTPADDYTDNTSLFYAYKTLNAAVDADKIDKYTVELAEGSKIEYKTDDNGDYYEVTLQFKKNGVAADLPKDEDGNYKLNGRLDDGTEYSYEFRYFFGREEPSDYWDYSILTDVTDTTHVGKGQMTFKISNTKFDGGLVNTSFYLMTSVTVGGITTESIKTYSLNAGYDEACTTGNLYTNYLGDRTNGSKSSGKTYDDLTGQLSQTWTNATTTTSGKTWTADGAERKYYNVSGGTTVSQTVAKDKLHADGSAFNTSDTYTLQAIVRSEKGAKLTLNLTHGDATATKTVIGLGMDENTNSTVNGYGCVDTVYSILSDTELNNLGIPKEYIPKGGWQKLEATVGSGDADGDLVISITSDKEFDLNDVVLLKDANTPGHYLTTVPAIEGDKNGYYEENNFPYDYSKFDLTKYEKFSFFDRGPNINRVVYMDRNSALFDAMYDPAGQAEYVPFNYVIDKQDGTTGLKMFRLFLKDGLPYYFVYSNTTIHQIACDYISYDREFTPGKMSTIALPFTVPVKTIFDWCTTGGYKAIEGKKSIDVTKLEPNWGVLKEISANGDVYFGQTWSYAADGSIGGTFRTRTLNSDSKFDGPIMFIKTVKLGKPFMGLKGDDNSGGLVLFTSNEAHSGGMPNAPFTNDDNGNNYAYRMVYACEMKYVALTDNVDQTGYGLQVNSDDGITAKNNNYLFGTYRPIADIAAMRNTDTSSGTYHFYYWSAKDGVFRKASEGDGHKAVKCPPFRAFLVAKESSSTSAKPSLGFKVVNMYDMGTTTGIKSVTDTAVRRTADNNVYSLTGVLVRRGTSTDGLPAGLYIVNGKKVIVNHK